MTHSAFFLTRPFDFTALGRGVAEHFRAPADKVLVHDNMYDLDPPYEDTPAGRLWRAYEACQIRVYVRDMSDVVGPFTAWFDVEMRDVTRKGFADRPLARSIARGLVQRVVFRDPVPDRHDNPIIEASQIAVDPDGTETPMWLVEYDEAGRSRIDLMLREEIWKDSKFV